MGIAREARAPLSQDETTRREIDTLFRNQNTFTRTIVQTVVDTVSGDVITNVIEESAKDAVQSDTPNGNDPVLPGNGGGGGGGIVSDDPQDTGGGEGVETTEPAPEVQTEPMSGTSSSTLESTMSNRQAGFVTTTKDITLVSASITVDVAIPGTGADYYTFEIRSSKRGRLHHGLIRSYAGGGISAGTAVTFPAQWIDGGKVDAWDSVQVYMNPVGSPATISLIYIILTLNVIPRQ